MRNLVAIAVLLVATTSAQASDTSFETQKGRNAAVSDIRAGRLILRTYGLAASMPTEYKRLLRERLGVGSKAVGGCVIDAGLAAETTAYNDVMKAEIAKRFGPDALKKIGEEAARTDRIHRRSP